jgi:hypothetical protein
MRCSSTVQAFTVPVCPIWEYRLCFDDSVICHTKWGPNHTRCTVVSLIGAGHHREGGLRFAYLLIFYKVSLLRLPPPPQPVCTSSAAPNAAAILIRKC